MTYYWLPLQIEGTVSLKFMTYPLSFEINVFLLLLLPVLVHYTSIHMYRCNSFIVDLRHKFTVRNMNEIPVFVQSSELSNRA